MTLTASPSDRKPLVCTSCQADEFACAIKAGLGGRRCCPDCSHVVVRTKREPKS